MRRLNLKRPNTKRHTLLVGLLLSLALLISAVPVLAQETLHSGTWTEKTYEIEGSWKIVEDGGKAFVELSADFSTKKAPDLKIFLSPLSLSEVGDKNATERAVLVSPLDSHKGAQRYEISAGTDLSRFKTIVIHCEKYSKLWGGAELR